MNPDDQDLFVVRPVENLDHPASWECCCGAPQEVVFEFFGRRLFEGFDVAALGIDSGHDVSDRAVFAGGIHGLEDDQQGMGAAPVESVV